MKINLHIEADCVEEYQQALRGIVADFPTKPIPVQLPQTVIDKMSNEVRESEQTPTPVETTKVINDQPPVGGSITVKQPVSPPDDSTVPTTVELDADGLPWDQRINSDTRKKTAKGIWKRRRGLDDDVYNTVRGELRQTMAAPTPATPPAQILPAGETQLPPPAATQSVPPPPNSEQPAAPAVPPPPTETHQVTDANGPAYSWPDVAKLVADKMAEQKLTIDDLATIANQLQVADWAQVATRPDLYGSFVAMVSQYGA